MHDPTKWAMDFILNLKDLYFEQRDLDGVLHCFSPDITWIGFGEHEICHNLQEAMDFFQKEKEAFHNTFHVMEINLQTVPVTACICSVFGSMKVKENDPYIDISPIYIRISAICVKDGDTVKLKHVHLSTPSVEQRGDEFFPTLITPENGRTLRKMVEEQAARLSQSNADLRALSDNVPGGMFRCLFDEKLTLKQMNDKFLSMFGYTKEEIAERFDNSFLNMIYPEDREASSQSAMEQIRKGPQKTLQYRVACKDGSLMWVMDKGQLVKDADGTQYFYCVIVDITQEKRVEEELRMSLDRHQIIMDQATDIIFEWDIAKNTLTYSSNWEKKFGYSPITQNATCNILKGAHLHPDDRDKFLNLADRARKGDTVPYAEEELRVQDKNGIYIWCRIRVSTQFNIDGVPAKAVGVIADITTEKAFQQELMKKAQIDAMTGVYNKATTKNLIEILLRSGPAGAYHAFLMIDFDDFKMVNDTQGHLFGDTVLAEMTSRIKKLFRSSDVIGRLGGDEFVVFLKNIPSEEFALEKANQILKLFTDSFSPASGLQISCSIGIALAPVSGEDFITLYKHADIALYSAKKQGKNRCELFDSTSMEGLEFYMQNNAVSRTKIDSDQNAKELGDSLTGYVFKVLYEAVDTETAVNLMMEIIGKYFDVSRAYIFENSDDNTYCTNTFEWCNDGIPPEIQNLQHVSFAGDIDSYYKNFDEDDIFCCKNVEELSEEQAALLQMQGIKSVLQCAIRDNGKIKGMVGFDECNTRRYWTQEQVNVLRLVSEVLCIFLFKQRAQSKLENSKQQLEMLLDRQNSFIYAIEKDTYKLLYFNKKTLNTTRCKIGERCHKVFFDRETPCDICPLKHREKSLEICNDKLDIWTSL